MISSGLIKAIQNIMRQDDGVDGDAQRLSQLVWMIFLKILDDNEQELELLNKNYTPAVPQGLQWRTWAANEEGLTGDKLLDFVNNQLFPDLRELKSDRSNLRTQVVRAVFEDSHNYMKNGTLLRQVINKINTINFNAKNDRHSFNDLYETLLKSLQSAGNAGEYYTPRPVTQFITDMVDPKFGESVLDPACGTGGFLSNAIEHIRAQVKTAEDERVLQDSIRGVEKKQLPHVLCTTNMILHGIEVPIHIRHDNTLKRPLKDYGPQDRVDVILTNPPFGGTEEPGIESNFPQTVRTRETADLFLVLIMKLLKSGGRAGLVLPDGTLFGEGVKTRIKEQLLEECNLHTIIRLPKTVFAPYTDIATNLLFFTKGEPTKEIWYYELSLPDGYKAYSKTKPIQHKEFIPIKEWWNSRAESEHAWKVSIEDVKELNYNLDISNPNKPDDPEDSLQAAVEAHEIKKVEIKAAVSKLIPKLEEVLTKTKDEDIEYIINNINKISELDNAATLIEKVILKSAVRGKLVPQIESEGSGNDLYEELKHRKTKDAKEGLIKKTKEFSDVSEKEIPFAIPDSWKWVRLADITNFSIGRTPKRAESKYWDDEYFPWVSIADLNDQDFVDETKEKISKKGFEEVFKETFAPAGTLLYSFKLTIGKMSILSIDATHNEAIASLATYDKITRDYLFKALKILDPTKRTNSAIKGKTLNSTSLSLLEIPLPPLQEQARINEKINELFSVTSELKDAVKIV